MPWKELLARDATQTMATDAQYITLPTDVEELKQVQIEDDTSSYEIAILGKADAERAYPLADENTTAEPEACYREDTLLFFVPSPNTALKVRLSYRAKVSETAPDDGFDNLIIAFATAEVFETIEHGRESADRWWRRFDRRLNRKRDSEHNDGERKRVDLRYHRAPGGARGIVTARDGAYDPPDGPATYAKVWW